MLENDTEPGNLGPRTLTDADIELIARAIERRMTSRFFRDLGHGVWKLAWRGVLLALMALAAWGSFKK